MNSVARGNPEASLKSGTALALVQSMALQFTSGLQQSYVKLIEDVGTSLIHILKDFANTPKFVSLVGKHNRPYIKEFVGDDLSAINRVVVDVGNPLSRTIAGRVQMAEQLLQMNLIKTPQQYFQVMETGRIESIYEGEMDQLIRIKTENEMLMEGKPAKARMLDSHRMHIMEHRCIMSSPDVHEDDTLALNLLNHIQEHINYLRTADPDLLALIGEQPLAPPMMQQGPQGGPPGMPLQPPPEAPPKGQDQIPKIQAQQQGMSKPGEQVQGPGQEQGVRLPNNPKVNANLLPSPELQEQAMGNVRPK